jgi:hypothetical protein
MLIVPPRILAILYIAFISLFALDVFESGYGWLRTMVALFMHLIPSFLMIAALVLAWRKALTGGAIFVALGILFTFFFRTYRELSVFLMISLPPLVVGVLFIINGMALTKAPNYKTKITIS